MSFVHNGFNVYQYALNACQIAVEFTKLKLKLMIYKINLR